MCGIRHFILNCGYIAIIIVSATEYISEWKYRDCEGTPRCRPQWGEQREWGGGEEKTTSQQRKSQSIITVTSSFYPMTTSDICCAFHQTVYSEGLPLCQFACFVEVQSYHMESQYEWLTIWVNSLARWRCFLAQYIHVYMQWDICEMV